MTIFKYTQISLLFNRFYFALNFLVVALLQGRVSGDYKPGNTQWKIGVTSMFAHALYIAPFKDTFWTTTTQDGNPYKSSEPNVELQAAIATLSTGPVGPSDKIGQRLLVIISFIQDIPYSH